MRHATCVRLSAGRRVFQILVSGLILVTSILAVNVTAPVPAVSATGPVVVDTFLVGNSAEGPLFSTRGVAVDPNTDRVYVTNGGDETISVIDGSTNTFVATIQVPGSPIRVAVNPNTTMVYVTNRGTNDRDDSFSVIDGRTNKIMATIQNGSTKGVAVDRNTARVYLVNPRHDSVSVIDGSTNTFVATIQVGDSPSWVAVNPSTAKVYVTNGGDNTVSVIDGSTNNILATIPVGDSLGGIAVDPNTARVYVTNGGNDTLVVIDGSTNNILATIPVGDSPRGVSVNPSTGWIYVTNGGDKTVSVIDGLTHTVVATIPVGGDPGGVAVNPTIGRVYVVDGRDNTVYVLAEERIVVLPEHDFSLSASAQEIRISQGESNTTSIIVSILNGNPETVFLSLSGLPPGTTSSFSPQSGTPDFSSNLTISTTVSTLPGSYTVTVNGTGGGITRSDTFMIIVTQALPSCNFSLSPSQSSMNISPGDFETITITVALTAGSTAGSCSTVSLILSGLPPGTTSFFNPANGTPPFSSTLTINSSASTPLGSYRIEVKGTPGAMSESAAFGLVMENMVIVLPPWAFLAGILAVSAGVGIPATWYLATRKLNLFRHARIEAVGERPAADHPVPSIPKSRNKVFVSYRREETKYLARAIFQDLTRNGYEVFIDVEGIDSGRFDKKIEKEIDSSDHFLALLDPESVRRFLDSDDWMRHEIEYALAAEKNVVPLLVNDFKFEESRKFLTGELNNLALLNGLSVPHDFFDAAMEKLRTRFLKQN